MARFVLSRVGQTIAVLLTAINLAEEPFSDKALRKAVTFGIDRKEILDRVEFGEGIVAHWPISTPMGAFYEKRGQVGQQGLRSGGRAGPLRE
jgi:ABC-type transport system substrate-binding protein